MTPTDTPAAQAAAGDDVPAAEYDPAPDLRRVFAMHSTSPPEGIDDGDRSPAINRVIASLAGGYCSTNLDVRDVRCLVVAFADAEGIIDALNGQLATARADLARLRAPLAGDLAAIEARAAAATPGPWRADHDFGHVNASALGPSHIVCGLDSELCIDTGGADIAFIAHAREDVPTLLAHIAATGAAHAAALDAARAEGRAAAFARCVAFARAEAARRAAVIVEHDADIAEGATYAAWREVRAPERGPEREAYDAADRQRHAAINARRAAERAASDALDALLADAAVAALAAGGG